MAYDREGRNPVGELFLFVALVVLCWLIHSQAFDLTNAK